MSAESPRCRLCASMRVQDLGALPDGDYFAGRVLAAPVAGGHLCRCAACGSMFRHPLLPAADYVALYEAGAPSHWQGGGSRRDLPIIRSLVAGEAGATTVLDVGCGGGEFLASLTGHLSTFGLEPSAAAVQAAARGVRIAGRLLEDLAAGARFDVITMIDVIEHVPEPGDFLAAAYAHLAPGGLLIIATGDPAAVAWRRVCRTRFWYASFPEHISFPSLGFFRIWSACHGAQVVGKVALRYQSRSTWGMVVALAIQAGYALSPTLFSRIGRLGQRLAGRPGPRQRCFSPGVPGLFVDHQVITIRRPRHAAASRC